MKFWEYVLARYAARKAERLIDTAVEATKKAVKGRFPTLGTAILWGIFIGIGAFGLMFFSGLILSLVFDINPEAEAKKLQVWTLIITSIFVIPVIVDKLFQKTTYGYKEVPTQVLDKRFKKGYRIENRLEPDVNLRVKLMPKHRVYNFISAALMFLGYFYSMYLLLYKL